MTGLVPVIHAVALKTACKARNDALHERKRRFVETTSRTWAWMTGTSPVMTARRRKS